MKYGNRKTTTFDGITFDSAKEARRWGELKLMQKAGVISDLKRQVKYELLPSQYNHGRCVERGVSYIADFVYKEQGNTVVEDTKGARTPDYIIKRKLMLYVYHIQIKEV